MFIYDDVEAHVFYCSCRRQNRASIVDFKKEKKFDFLGKMLNTYSNNLLRTIGLVFLFFFFLIFLSWFQFVMLHCTFRFWLSHFGTSTVTLNCDIV